VPALPGCISQGKTRTEALANIKESIELYLDSLEAHGEPVPPSSLPATKCLNQPNGRSTNRLNQPIALFSPKPRLACKMGFFDRIMQKMTELITPNNQAEDFQHIFQ
jgi:hypothetical protein